MKSIRVRSFAGAVVIVISLLVPKISGSMPNADVATWMQLLPTSSPPARSYLAMTYDAASGKIVMFGGYDGTGYLKDTWTFDGVSWTHVISRLSPPPCANAQMAYDSVTRTVVLFGAYNGTNDLGD